LQEYKKYNAEALLPGVISANDENVKTFYLKQKTSGKPIRRTIDQIVRIKDKGKEWFYYHQTLESQDALGNDLSVFMPSVGRYEKPTFEFIHSPEGAKIPNGIKSKEMIYELEWPKQWNEELEQDLSEKVSLIVATNSRKYGGFDFQDFKNRSFDQLVQIGKYGVVNPSPKIVETEDQRLREAKRTR
jgi:hypothetical protein